MSATTPQASQATEPVTAPIVSSRITGAIVGATLSARRSSRIGHGLAAALTAVIVCSATLVVIFAWVAWGRPLAAAAEQGIYALLIVIGPVLGFTAAPFWIAAFSWRRRLLVQPHH